LEPSIFVVLPQARDHVQVFERRSVADHRASGRYFAQRVAYDLAAMCFGSASLKPMSSGFATEPISWATQSRRSFFNSKLSV